MPSAGKLSAADAAEAGQESGHSDRDDFPVDEGRCTAFPRERRCGLRGNADGVEGNSGKMSRRYISREERDPYMRRLLGKMRSTFWGHTDPDCDLRRLGLKLAECN